MSGLQWRSTHGRRPSARNLVGLPFSWPGWHRDPDGRQRLGPKRPKLKVRTHRNGEAHAGFDRDDLLALIQLSPHLSTTREEKPDFLHASMDHRSGCETCRKFKMGDASTTKLQQDTNIRSVGGSGIRRYGQSFGAEVIHAEYLAHASCPVNHDAFSPSPCRLFAWPPLRESP